MLINHMDQLTTLDGEVRCEKNEHQTLEGNKDKLDNDEKSV